MIVASHFVIEYTDPPTEERRWAQNRSLSVVCENAERAIELLRTVSENGKIHVVRRVGTDKAMIIDEKLENEA